jgi:serine/threonine protein kinase
MTEWIGRTISKVEIRSLLGRGGMADVYLGRHITLNRDVAVKVLQSHLSDDASFLSRFTSEAQAVAAMRHPNIVQVFDFDLADDRPYMVMELLEGLSLKDYLRALRAHGQILPLPTITRLIASLAAALDYAHARGIVHRDVKPANIMLRSEHSPIDAANPLPADAEPVLTDFGVARVANAIGQTATGQIVGTPAYMSPEQIQGKSVDARSDIYSLGIVLYEMLTNELPFDSDTQASILLQHLTEPVPPLPTQYASLQPLIDRVLAKNPAMRFQKAIELADVLGKTHVLPFDSSSLSTGTIAATTFDPSTAQLDRPASAVADTPAGTSTAPQQPVVHTSLNPIWIAAGIGIMALIIGVVALVISIGSDLTSEVTPTPAETAAATSTPGEIIALETTEVAGPVPGDDTPVGVVVFQDDTLRLSLDGLQAPPEDTAYEAWLTEPDAGPFSLGVIEVAGGKASLTFSDPGGINLLARFSGLAISQEPSPDPDPDMSGQAIYAAQVSPELVRSIRLLLEVSGGAEMKQALLTGLTMQAGHYNSHLGYTIEALNSGNLDGSKTHSEHTINIVAGREGSEYGDWNDNGRPENPGDAVGLRPYLQILEEAASGAALDPDAAEGTQAAADAVKASVDTLLKKSNEAVRLAEQVATADSIDLVRGVAVQLDGVRVQTAFATLTQQAEALSLAISVEVVPVGP